MCARRQVQCVHGGGSRAEMGVPTGDQADRWGGKAGDAALGGLVSLAVRSNQGYSPPPDGC